MKILIDFWFIWVFVFFYVFILFREFDVAFSGIGDFFDFISDANSRSTKKITEKLKKEIVSDKSTDREKNVSEVIKEENVPTFKDKIDRLKSMNYESREGYEINQEQLEKIIKSIDAKDLQMYFEYINLYIERRNIISNALIEFDKRHVINIGKDLDKYRTPHWRNSKIVTKKSYDDIEDSLLSAMLSNKKSPSVGLEFEKNNR